jgi:hypothetical protein
MVLFFCTWREKGARTRVRKNERKLETPTKDAKGTKASTEGGGKNEHGEDTTNN